MRINPAKDKGPIAEYSWLLLSLLAMIAGYCYGLQFRNPMFEQLKWIVLLASVFFPFRLGWGAPSLLKSAFRSMFFGASGSLGILLGVRSVAGGPHFAVLLLFAGGGAIIGTVGFGVGCLVGSLRK